MGGRRWICASLLVFATGLARGDEYKGRLDYHESGGLSWMTIEHGGQTLRLRAPLLLLATLHQLEGPNHQTWSACRLEGEVDGDHFLVSRLIAPQRETARGWVRSWQANNGARFLVDPEEEAVQSWEIVLSAKGPGEPTLAALRELMPHPRRGMSLTVKGWRDTDGIVPTGFSWPILARPRLRRNDDREFDERRYPLLTTPEVGQLVWVLRLSNGGSRALVQQQVQGRLETGWVLIEALEPAYAFGQQVAAALAEHGLKWRSQFDLRRHDASGAMFQSPGGLRVWVTRGRIAEEDRPYWPVTRQPFGTADFRLREVKGGQFIGIKLENRDYSPVSTDPDLVLAVRNAAWNASRFPDGPVATETRPDAVAVLQLSPLGDIALGVPTEVLTRGWPRDEYFGRLLHQADLDPNVRRARSGRMLLLMRRGPEQERLLDLLRRLGIELDPDQARGNGVLQELEGSATSEPK